MFGRPVSDSGESGRDWRMCARVCSCVFGGTGGGRLGRSRSNAGLSYEAWTVTCDSNSAERDASQSRTKERGGLDVPSRRSSRAKRSASLVDMPLEGTGISCNTRQAPKQRMLTRASPSAGGVPGHSLLSAPGSSCTRGRCGRISLQGKDTISDCELELGA